MAIEMKHLEEVARIYDDRCAPVKGAQRILRKGPYRLYVETGSIAFDDYSFDGLYLLLGSVCNVESATGCLQVTEARGKFSVTDLYHVVACDNEDDTVYLRHVLSRIPAALHADASGQTVRLSERSLRYLSVPWPEKRVRRAVVRRLRELELLCRDSDASARRLFDEGVERYREAAETSLLRAAVGDVCSVHEGMALPADKRIAKGGVPVVSSQGIVAYTDEEGVREPCVVVGQAGQYLLGHRMPSGAYPLVDALALTVDDQASLSFESLVFALGAFGVRPRLRVVDGSVNALALPLEKLSDMEIPLVAQAEREERFAELHVILGEVDELEHAAEAANAEAKNLVEDLLAGGDEAIEQVEPWAVDVGEESVALFDEPMDAPCEAVEMEMDGDLQARLKSLVQDVRSDLARAMRTPASSFDAAWEVLPLLFLRVFDGGSAWSRVVAAADACIEVDEELDRIASQDPKLSFLGGIALRTSALDAAAQCRMVEQVGTLSMKGASGMLLRWFVLEHETELIDVRGDVVERRIDAPCPAAVSGLLSRIALAFCPEPARAYDPCVRAGSVLASFKRLVPNACVAGQTERFSDALAAMMAARCEGQPFDEGTLAVGLSLTEDVHAGSSAEVVLSVLPPNQGEWTLRAPDPQDVRWAFGVPPRNKANLAWVQQAFSHRAPGGIAVLAVSNAMLHESRGCEPTVRAAMIESGCVRAVVSLPGGLFDDGRAPMSIVALGDSRSGACNTLFVNALECGAPSVSAEGRVLPTDACDRIVSAVKEWVAIGTCEPVVGFARSVPKEEVAALGDLTPWSFV